MSTTTGWLGERGRSSRGSLALTVVFGELAGILLILQTGLLVRVADALIFHHAPIDSLYPLFIAAAGVIGLRALLIWASKRSGQATASAVKRTLRDACVERIAGIGPDPGDPLHARIAQRPFDGGGRGLAGSLGRPDEEGAQADDPGCGDEQGIQGVDWGVVEDERISHAHEQPGLEDQEDAGKLAENDGKGE